LEHALLTVAALVEVLAQFFGEVNKLHRKILLLFQAAILLKFVFGGAQWRR
jgi:hypothetical protein